MEQSKNQKQPRKRALGIIVALVLLLCVSVGGTLAYLVATDGPITNIFSPATTAIRVAETRTDNVESSIVVTNTGNTAVYIRVALTSGTKNAEGNLVVDSYENLNNLTLGSGWVKHTDGYYYYTSPVSASGATGNLLGSSVTLAEGQTITVLAQCVQSEPSNAAVDAWGVDPSGLKGGN